MSSTFVRIGRYVLDVSLEENHTFEADVTDFPVESGGSISDNIRPKPIKVTITGIVSDTPLGSNAINKADFPLSEFAAINTTNDNTTTALASIQFLRSEEAYGYLKFIWASRDVVTIRTSLATFDNMAMTSFEVPRSKETTGGLKFTASFQQIQKVTNARQRKKVSVRNGHGKKDNGAQAGQKWSDVPILWKKGRPPGSAEIYDSEIVQWYFDPVQASAAGNTATNALQTGVAVTNAGKAHAWYHVNDGSPLSDNEVKALKLDMARDRYQRTPVAQASAQVVGRLAAVEAALGVPTKSATQNLTDQFNKSAAQGKATPKDPNFKDKSTFNQGFTGKPKNPFSDIKPLGATSPLKGLVR